jgi:hypothetical protein
VKVLVPKGDEAGLFKWVAVLTGSKNALKGAGFFLGGFLLSAFGFRGGLAAMAIGVLVVLVAVLTLLPASIGQAKRRPAFMGILSNSPGINRLSLARMALFAARDVWFVVSVPIFFASVLGWSFMRVGGFMSLWVIAYGGVQSLAPVLLAKATHGKAPGPALAALLGLALAAVTALIPLGLRAGAPPGLTMLGGLTLFGIVFALNSSVHSYLVLAYSEADRVSLSVGFYYMANAAGRLIGTLLSGVLYQRAGVAASLWGAVVLAAAGREHRVVAGGDRRRLAALEREDDRAVGVAFAAERLLALCETTLQSVPEALQHRDPRLQIIHFQFEHPLHLPALRRAAPRIRAEQLADLGERQPALLRLLDEPQPLEDAAGVDAVAGCRARRRLDHSEPLVIAQGVGFEAGLRGDVANRQECLAPRHHALG